MSFARTCKISRITFVASWSKTTTYITFEPFSDLTRRHWLFRICRTKIFLKNVSINAKIFGSWRTDQWTRSADQGVCFKRCDPLKCRQSDRRPALLLKITRLFQSYDVQYRLGSYFPPRVEKLKVKNMNKVRKKEKETVVKDRYEISMLNVPFPM